MAVFADLQLLAKGVVIHHWDTDGIVSAALLRNYLRTQFPHTTVDLFMPTITNYYLTDDQYDYLQGQGYEFVITCDLNFPSSTVQDLANRWPGQVYFFDHHHHPTAYDQVHYFNMEHPACASHIAQRLGLRYDLLPVIAMVGDREEHIQQDKIYYPHVQAVMAEHGLTFSQLLEARRLIDSNYIVDDYAGIIETVQLLQDDPLAVFSDTRLRTNVTNIDATLASFIELPPTQLSDKLWYWEIDTPLNILSHITRALSRRYPAVVVFTRQLKNNQYNCYVRKRQVVFDARQIIAYAHELGLNSGGKEEVAGIIIPADHVNEMFPKIQQQLITLIHGTEH